MTSRIYDLYLEEPRIEGKRIVYAWKGDLPLKGNSFWVEYPNTFKANALSCEVLSAYLPVCLALTAFGRIRAHLPAGLDETVRCAWLDVIRDTTTAVFKQSFQFELIDGPGKVKPDFWQGEETALLFGGGTESLLCLARLRKRGINPVLVSFCGPNWNGSDEVKNPDKFRMDEAVCRDFGLKYLKIRTSFRDIIRSHDEVWRKYLAENAWNIVTTALFPLFTFIFCWPAAAEFGIARLVAGNERDNNIGRFYYSFSGEAVQKLKNIHPSISYESWLNEEWKTQIVRSLFFEYPEMLKYQYSCICNDRQRWCLNCEKCFLNYLLFKIYKVDCSVAGMDESLVKKRLKVLVWKARWKIVSKDPSEVLAYQQMLEEAIKNGSAEAEELLKRVFRYRPLTYLLNFFRQRSLIQSVKRPLKKIFYDLQGYGGDL